MFKGCFKEGCFKGVFSWLEWYFIAVLRVFQENFKCFPRKVLGCFKEVSRVFQDRFKGVSRKIEGCFNVD